MDFTHLGERIRTERTTRKLSQFQLAVLSGVTPNTIANLEGGKTPNASLEVVLRVLTALGLKLSDFEEVA
jgi:transcriptional regulator with XRE-family HTH domain